MTKFMVALFRMTDAQLANASAAKAAEVYGIKPEWALFNIQYERSTRR